MRHSTHVTITTLATLSATALVIFGLACGGDKKPEPQPAPTPPPPGATPAPAPEPVPVAARGDEIRLYDFVNNRHLAHQLIGGGLLVTPGSGGFAKYEHFARPKRSWTKGSKDGKKVATADKYASLDVPVTQAGGNVTMRLFAEGASELEVKAGGKSNKVSLKAGWQTVSVPSSAPVGDQRFQLVSTAKTGPTIEWLQFGGTPPAGDVVPALYDPELNALVMPEGGGAAWYVAVPQKGRVVAAVRGTGCKLNVLASNGSNQASGTITGNGAVELGALAGQTVRLELTAVGCPKAVVSDAGIAIPGKAPEVKKAPKPKYVVLWVMDSLRADRVRPFNPKARPETPVFESLAKKGALFMRNYVQGNESRASHASIWTSTYVGTHRYIPSGNKGVPGSLTTIDAVMKTAGYMTSGVSANGFIVKKNGFGTKWDAYRNHIHDGGGVKGEDVLKYAIASVDGKKDKPWFLYLGTIDTHVSWRAKEPWISKYDPGYKGRFEKEISGTDVDKGVKLTDREKEHVRAIYDSNVSYQDKLLGDLLAKLDAWGIANETMIIITADHGDEQWENDRVGHGSSLVEWLEHVPLVVVYPPLVPAGIVQEGSEIIDILPTIIDAIGGTLAPTMQGRSLIPLTQGVGVGYPQPAIASRYELEWAMRLGDWKIKTSGGDVSIYNLGSDYYEKKNLADKNPVERRFLTDALSTFLVNQKDWRKSTWGLANNMTAAGAAQLDR